MGLALLLLAGGAALLFAGGWAAIRGAGRLARAAGISLFAVGAVLFGIDLEGLTTTIVAAASGRTAVAGGEVFGTLAFVFGGAFGAALIVARRPVASPGPEMVLAPAAGLFSVAVAASDTAISRTEGALLVVLYVAYVVYVVRGGRLAESTVAELEEDAADDGRGRLRPLVLALVGLGALYGGATLLVAGGVRLLDRSQLAPGFVGAALLAVLTSVDEVLLEVVPARQGKDDLATGNAFGTLAAFTTGVIGIAALVRPLDLDGAAMATLVFAAALYALVATVFLLRDRAGTVLGAVLLASYLVWLAVAARF